MEKLQKKTFETSAFDTCPSRVFVMSPENKVLINDVADLFGTDRNKISDRLSLVEVTFFHFFVKSGTIFVILNYV